MARCRLVDLPVVDDDRGKLTAIEGAHLEFDIARVYYVYDVPGGEGRVGHAHRTLEQLLVAIAGSFEVLVDDGSSEAHFRLDRPDRGLYVPPMIWRRVSDFSSGSVCLVLASAPYDEADYIRDHAEFVAAARAA